MHLPPVVYIGSSIAPEKVLEILPDAQIMPPVQRGDLYRDRMLGFSFFIIIDGVFFNDLAISPREIIDVLDDGAILMGASSMGAIRAAECWPAGMLGVGSIYRLFRRGSLDSDEEVAVTFGPVNPHLLVSVPLVNVRYATTRLVRLRMIDPCQAEAILNSAKDIFYANRNWGNILSEAGIDDSDGQLKQALRTHDLKQIDALRAIRKAASMLKRDPGLLDQVRTRETRFIPNSHVRERQHDAYAGTNPETLQEKLWHWLLASGRVYHYPALAGLLSTTPDSHPETSAGQHHKLTNETLESSSPLLGWEILEASGELDAAVFRYRAIGMAAAEARRMELKPTANHMFLASTEIAIAQGFTQWKTMQSSLAAHSQLWFLIEACRDELSLAKSFREYLFNKPDDMAPIISWS